MGENLVPIDPVFDPYPYLWEVTRVSINRSPSNLGAKASSTLSEFDFWETAMSSFVDLATGEDAVTRISWSLKAVNAADAAAAAAHMSARGCLILQFFLKQYFEESKLGPDRRNPYFTIEKEDLFKLAEQAPEYQV